MSATADRLHGLDALRAGALLLGLVLHASLAYLPGAQAFWPLAAAEPLPVLGPVFVAIHLARMPVFFLLAGFFAVHGVRRMGLAAFARNRVQRILVPLLVAWPIVMSAIVAALWLHGLLQAGPNLPPAPPGPAFTPRDFPLAHLWFLWLLSWLYVAALALRPLARRLPMAALAACMASPWSPLVLGLPGAVALATTPAWLPWFGVPTPDQTLLPGAAAWVAYGLAFGAGIVLAQGDLALLSRRMPLRAGLALALLAACLAVLGPTPDLHPAAPGWRTLALAWLYASAAWALTLAAVGLALRGPRRPLPAVRHLADASYWIYLVHLPLVMGLQALVAPRGWPAALQFGFVVAMTLALSLLSYRLGVRHRAIGHWLHGQRSRLRERAA